MHHVMYSLEYIITAKIQIHNPIICRDIPHFVFWRNIGTICDVISYLICIIKIVKISGTGEDITKRKTPSFIILKGLLHKIKFFST